MLSETLKIVNGLSPSADRFNTSPATDVVNAGLCDEVTFIVQHQGGTTGKATLTVEACDDVTPSNTAAVAFRYRRKTTGASDVWGAITAATTAGIDTVAGEDTAIEVSVKAAELPAGKPYVRLKCTEAVDDPVVGAVLIICSGLRYGGANAASVLS